jgi:hypothetical protein
MDIQKKIEQLNKERANRPVIDILDEAILKGYELEKAPKTVLFDKIKKYNEMCKLIQNMENRLKCFESISINKPDFESFSTSVALRFDRCIILDEIKAKEFQKIFMMADEISLIPATKEKQTTSIVLLIKVMELKL